MKDILHLEFAFVVFVATSGSLAAPGSVAGPGVGSRLGISSIFFIGNNLLLKLLRTFSLVLNNNPKLFKKDFFSSVLYLYQNSLIY